MSGHRSDPAADCMLCAILEKWGFEGKKVLKAILIGLAASLILLYKYEFDIARLTGSVVASAKEFAQVLSEKAMLGRWAPRSAEQEEVIVKRGGYVGGLVNDGNTCFMNSVLQSLASSAELSKFMAAVLQDGSQQTEDGKPEGRPEGKPEGKPYGKRKKLSQRQADAELLARSGEPDVHFTAALQDLFSKINAKHYRNRPWYKTNKLLKTMSKAPNKNILLGYDQEDAQEFFQTLLSELEKNVHSVYGKPPKDVEPVPIEKLPEDAVIGQERIGEIGDVFIPTEQIDPNSVLKSDKQYFTPFKILTPLDGLTAERIGCLQCGENGGIRYSVFSGLSLNLPGDNIGSSIKLSELLDDWSKPEIIEGVDCNRCALLAVLEHLNGQLETIQSQSEPNQKIVSLIESRVKEVKAVLAKPAIDDEDFKKIHTENMIRKSSKSKQILISRPPPLLSIHINRSVFDPRTYMIRKNNSRVIFKTRLNLSPWCCNYNEINLDARLPMSKKEEKWQESSEDDANTNEYYTKLHQRFEKEFEDSEEENSDDQMFKKPSRTVENYDPLNGAVSSESDSSSEDDIDEIEEVEVDALGNTVVKKTTKRPLLGGNEGMPSEGVDVEGEEDSCMENRGDEDVQDEEESDDNDGEYEDEEDDSEDSEDSLPAPPIPTSETVISNVPSGPLTYVLRSVIVHYGTHNYGHYIAFRKFRGCWWRISDESVYIVDEKEVLSTPGVFMLFYEYDYNSQTGKMNDDMEFQGEGQVEIEGEAASV